jgi:Flp pilus assembly protein TadD
MDDAATEADRQVRSAVELYRQGDRAAAEARCRETLALMPGHRDAQVLLGLVLNFEARYGEAEEIFAALALQEPHESAHWMNLGTARRGAKRFDEALRAYNRAAEFGAASAEFYLEVGLTHLDRCDFEAARAVLAHAATLAPQHAEIRFRHAQACYECLRTEEASRLLEGWEELPDLTSELAANIGFLLMNLGEAARAQLALHQAALDPAPDPSVTLTLVQTLERTNRLAEARALFDPLAHDPRANSLGNDLLLTEAQLAERESKHESARRLLEQALQQVGDFHLRHYQLFRLAKCLDALHLHEEAFDALLEAHRSQAAHLAMTAPAVALRGGPVMAMTQFGCDAADVASWDDSHAPSWGESPVFIVAFPRSGTTLLELTLDAHPLLKSMDEQPFLQSALQELHGPGVQYPSELGRLSSEQLDRVRASYWKRVNTKMRIEPGQRLIDKNPLNILRLPVIRRLFPNAHILFAVRHPCDVLLSCYMQHFRSPDFAKLCSDLGTLALGYRRALDFWYQQFELLAPAVREVRYESFVANFETEIHAISDFLKLSWDERLLAPATHALSKGYISTPSYAQVVQPVHQSSIGRWRAYERYFAPILPLLRPYLDRWGYEV